MPRGYIAAEEAEEKERCALVDRFNEIIETGAQKMDAAQLRESEKKFNDAIDRAVANKQRRETA